MLLPLLKTEEAQSSETSRIASPFQDSIFTWCHTESSTQYYLHHERLQISYYFYTCKKSVKTPKTDTKLHLFFAFHFFANHKRSYTYGITVFHRFGNTYWSISIRIITNRWHNFTPFWRSTVTKSKHVQVLISHSIMSKKRMKWLPKCFISLQFTFTEKKNLLVHVLNTP